MPILPPKGRANNRAQNRRDGKPSNRSRESNRLAIGSLVEFEQHGQPQLGVIVSEEKNKWHVLSASGETTELAATRLYLLPEKLPEECTTPDAKMAYLQRVFDQSVDRSSRVKLESFWKKVSRSKKAIKVSDAVRFLFPDAKLADHIAVRHALLADTVFFKRKKHIFEPRKPEAVESFRQQAEIEKKKLKAQDELTDALATRLKSPKAKLPPSIAMIEQLAAIGTKAPDAKDALRVVDRVIESLGLDIRGKADERAFALLVQIGHFKPHQHLALIRFDRGVEFATGIQKTAKHIASTIPTLCKQRTRFKPNCPVITIDSATTLDIDDAISLEKTDAGYRLGVHISDVGSAVSEDSPIFGESFRRGTSIYFPDGYVPMAPTELSENALSLIEGRDRLALSFFIELDSDGNILSRDIQQSTISVTHRLTYDTVNDVLYNERETPDIDSALKDCLLEMWKVTCALEARRIAAGASQFHRRELSPRIQDDGTITLETTVDESPGFKLVGEMMILANETGALYAGKHEVPLLFRGQEPPDVNIEEEGLKVEEGPAREYYVRSLLKRSELAPQPLVHYGLGVQAYAHLTSPIRRMVDLLNHKQLISHLNSGTPRYTADELLSRFEDLGPALDEAQTIQNDRKRYWLYHYFEQKGITEFKATVVKIDGNRPLAELDEAQLLIPFNAKGASKEKGHGKKLGERVTLTIDAMKPRKEQLRLSEI